MTPKSQFEASVLSLIDRAQRGQSVEDALVEMKSTFPTPLKAARILAGHCNAAMGREIVWILGCHENGTIVDLDRAEIANWWPQVASHFCGRIFPSMLEDLIVPVGDKRVHAFKFDTSRAPYVIVNDTSQGGGPDRETPWREGTRVRSARRDDLIRLLGRVGTGVDFEVVEVSLNVEKRLWRCNLNLYATPRGQTPVTLRRDKVQASLCFTNDPPVLLDDDGVESIDNTVQIQESQIRFHDCGAAKFWLSGKQPAQLHHSAPTAVRFEYTPNGGQRSTVDITLRQLDDGGWTNAGIDGHA